MAACAFAMEATTASCAHFIDSGFEDYMLERAMLKVWSTDVLWQIVNDTMQIYGGKGFFLDEPYERWMRDARLNLVGEGANDVLRAFIAMVGIKPLADHLMPVLEERRRLARGCRDAETTDHTLKAGLHIAHIPDDAQRGTRRGRERLDQDPKV